MSAVEIRHGDMFDGPSDLVVLPCSTAGTITSFVREKLIHYQIPPPRPGMRFGDVQVLPFVGGENIAQFVAYAASVQGNNSSQESIRRIGERLGEQTQREESIRKIAAPLLGAGAGGLRSEVVVSRLREGFLSTSHRDSVLVISVLHRPVFDRLSGALFMVAAREDAEDHRREAPPRVFLSYSHTAPEHEEWVASLATFLRHNGVDARLDIWHLRRGMDLAQFMTNELALAARVVLVSDERYAEKADGRVGGVGWETMIIQGDMARLPADTTKYLVLVRSKKVDAGLPLYLKTKFVIHWPDNSVDDKNQKILLRELFDFVPVPEVGKRPLVL